MRGELPFPRPPAGVHPSGEGTVVGERARAEQKGNAGQVHDAERELSARLVAEALEEEPQLGRRAVRRGARDRHEAD